MEETFDVPEETHAKLTAAGIRIETEPVRALLAKERQLESRKFAMADSINPEEALAPSALPNIRSGNFS
jgi:hypothetical protein